MKLLEKVHAADFSRLMLPPRVNRRYKCTIKQHMTERALGVAALKLCQIFSHDGIVVSHRTQWLGLTSCAATLFIHVVVHISPPSTSNILLVLAVCDFVSSAC
eukprot:6465413-Amphidinium_carterae.2